MREKVPKGRMRGIVSFPLTPALSLMEREYFSLGIAIEQR
jgi:hypothetical protein